MATALAPMHPREIFLQIERDLNAQVFERRTLIRALITAILAHEQNAPIPLAVIGPGGTAKTAALKALCRIIVGKYFPWLMSPFTTPEDIFGAVRTKKMIEEDVVERNPQGKAPDADVIYLDEWANANESILVSMNDALAEGEWSNGAGKQQLKAKLIVSSANRVPDTLGEQPVLAATWDRFVLRVVVDYLKEEANFRAMLRGVMARRRNRQGSNMNLSVMVTEEQLEQAKEEIRRVDVDPVENTFVTLWEQVRGHKLPTSDRRFGQLLAVVQVQAWLDGRTVAQPSDLAILADCLWERPEQVKDVKKIVLGILTTWFNDLIKYEDEAEEQISTFRRLEKDGTFLARAAEVNGKLKGCIRGLKTVLRDATLDCEDKAVLQLVKSVMTESNPKDLLDLIGALKATEKVPFEILETMARVIGYNEAVVQGSRSAS